MNLVGGTNLMDIRISELLNLMDIRIAECGKGAPKIIYDGCLREAHLGVGSATIIYMMNIF